MLVIMLIKDLPEDIKKLAYFEAKRLGGFTYKEVDSHPLTSLFNWNSTSQGQDFWAYVNLRDFEKARALLRPKKVLKYKIKI
jgi:hypothetical protein